MPVNQQVNQGHKEKSNVREQVQESPEQAIDQSVQFDPRMLQRARHDTRQLPPPNILRLQRVIGNQSVQTLLLRSSQNRVAHHEVVIQRVLDEDEDEEETAGEPEEETASEPEEETASEPEEETVSEPEGETVSEPEEETVSEPEGETVSEPEDETVSEPEGETVSEPEDETVSEPEDETVSEPEDETVSEPEDETVSEPEDLLAQTKDKVLDILTDAIGDPSDAMTAASIHDDGSSDPERVAIVTTAMAEVTGEVHAKKFGDKDQAGRPTRQGWQKLTEYFHLAAPGLWSDELIKYHASVGGKQGLPHWCGIFALYVLKSAGRSVGTWHQGGGIGDVKGIKLVSKSKVKIGDIGFMPGRAAHHFIVSKISSDGNTIESIDGNSGGTGDSTITAGTTRSIKSVHSFYTAF